MSAFANPFAQFGDYRGNTVTHDDLVTSNYLTGLPDPKQIGNEQASLLFKQLLKRDSRTKQRALSDLNHWVLSQSQEIEDSVHLAYIQLYAKLSIDVSPEVRTTSQVVLTSLYQVLGKKSTKYLKYSVGPWVAATYDTDSRPANAASLGLSTIFPGNKQAMLFEKFRTSFLDFIYDSCMNTTALSLSDERYVTKEEASQKYTRLVNGCLEILINNPDLFNLDFSEVFELVETGRLWKFFSSSDSALARVSLKLAQTHLNMLSDFVSLIWKELLRAGRKNVGGSGVALDIIQFMNIITKKFHHESWPNDIAQRNDSMTSIAQFIISDPPHPARFWPLLYNLVLMIPEPPSRDFTVLYKPLEKTVMKIRHNAELEESCWGCFVSLASKMGDEYVLKVFKAVELRSKNGQVPKSSIAKFLARISDGSFLHEYVAKQLKSDKVTIEYLDILALTHKFKEEIENYGISNDTSAEMLANLLKADSTLKLPQELHITDDPAWISVAVHSQNVDAQHIVEVMAGCGFESHILQNAHALSDRGAKFWLDDFVEQNIHSYEVCKEAVAATFTPFIKDETSISALRTILQVALHDESQIKDVLRFIRGHTSIVKDLSLKDQALLDDLETLSVEDTQGVIEKTIGLSLTNTSSEVKASEDHPSTLEELDFENLDLSAPREAAVNALRAQIPYKPDCDASAAISLAKSVHSGRGKLSASNSAKLLTLKAYFDSWLLVSVKPELDILKNWMEITPSETDSSSTKHELWKLLDSSNYGVAFHAAIALSRMSPLSAENYSFDRSYFTKPTLKGSVLAFFSCIQDSPQYESMQSAFAREAISNRLPQSDYTLVDRAYLPETASVSIEENDKNALQRILTFRSHVENLSELTFQSTDRLVEFAALCGLCEIPSISDLLDYAVNIPEESGMDQLSAFKCLELINNSEEEIPFTEEILESIEQILRGSDISSGGFLEKTWIALQLVRKSIHSGSQFDITDPAPLSEELSASAELVSWLIHLDYLKHISFPDNLIKKIYTWISPYVKSLSNKRFSTSKDAEEYVELPMQPPQKLESVAAHVLYKLCLNYPGSVREWYRDQREKTFVKQLDSVLSNIIVPNIVASWKTDLENTEFEDNVEVSVNEKLREIRARREIEDEVEVEVVIWLPEQYPAKPATVDIRNLGSVSDAKKRHWLLEARQTIQNHGVLPALKSVLTRLNNYLEGIEPCAICYMMVNDLNKLPNKTCSQCHNIYHTDCLYQWFSTNNNKLCPMCRNPM